MASRPAQGNNSSAGLKWPSPAYRMDPAPKVVGSGSISRPKKLPSFRGGRLVTDATPKVVTL